MTGGGLFEGARHCCYPCLLCCARWHTPENARALDTGKNAGMILRRINPAAMNAAHAAHLEDTCAWLKHTAFGPVPSPRFQGLYSAVVDDQARPRVTRRRPR